MHVHFPTPIHCMVSIEIHNYTCTKQLEYNMRLFACEECSY